MKCAKSIPSLLFLLASLMVASGALAQTKLAQTKEDRQIETKRDSLSEDAISAARSRYTQNAKGEGASRDAGDDNDHVLAQLSRPKPMPPFPPHRGYPRGNYPAAPWMEHGNAGHAVIGAIIGFGLGAALGATANSDRHPRATVGAVVLFGGLGALIGGVIGGSHGGPYAFAHRRKTYPPSWREGEGSELSAHFIGSRYEDKSAEQTASVKLVSHLSP
jgi:hypothetical protein